MAGGAGGGFNGYDEQTYQPFDIVITDNGGDPDQQISNWSHRDQSEPRAGSRTGDPSIGIAGIVLTLPVDAEVAPIVVAGVVIYAIVQHFNNGSTYDDSQGMPDPYHPPDTFVPHDQGHGRYGPRYLDTEDGSTWTWHDQPGHGPPHWDIGSRDGGPGSQEVWPLGGVRMPKPPGKWW